MELREIPGRSDPQERLGNYYTEIRSLEESLNNPESDEEKNKRRRERLRRLNNELIPKEERRLNGG